MSKTTIQNYSFNKTAKTVKLLDYTTISLEGLLLITNVTRNTVLYQFTDSTLGGTVSGNVVTLAYDTSAMANTDKLQIIYEDRQAFQSVGNARKRFRDGFAIPFATPGIPDPSVWTLTNTDGHLVTQGGNSSGASYLAVHLNPLLEDTEVTLTSVDTFRMPIKAGAGVSISQRIMGQEVYAGVIGDDGTGNPDFSTTPIADKAITGSIVILTNVGTVTLANHGYTGGDRISIYGVADSRMNVGPVAITVIDANTFTVPIVATNGTYPGTGGFIRYADPLRYAYNGAGYLWGDSLTVTTASLVARRNGSRFRTLAATVTNSTAIQSNLSPYTDAFNSAANFEVDLRLEETSFRSFTADSVATASGPFKYTQGVPDEGVDYHLHYRARTLKGSTKPIARITAIAKTGTTTATVTTDVPHGLTIADFIQIYGVRDQVNYPNLTVATAVASVVDSTHFTVVIGTATTTSSLDGGIWRVQGGTLAPGVFPQVVQSISQTNGIISVVGNGTWATPLPGEYVYIYGLTAGSTTYEGAYKVLRVNTTTLELQGNTGVADFGSITSGGAVMRMTSMRLHFSRVMDYTRHAVEIMGGRGNTTDINNAVPVAIAGGAVVAVSQSTGASTTQWSAGGWGGFLVNDVLAAALTATTTTAAISPGSNINIGTYAHSFNVIVTAVTGTTPTLDVGVEESMDNGINWTRIYDFERITANGAYTSPLIMAQRGTRYRYVQTVTGTSPSFTRAINRLQFSSLVPIMYRWIDRSIVLTTANSTTPTYTAEGCDTFFVAFNVGAITTTAPQIQIEGSEDGTNWYSIGAPITAVASSTVAAQFTGTMPKFVRGRVATAGAGVTAGYLAIKCYGR